MPISKELVSVIIPCYQQAHFLAESIESVLTQTYVHHEIIVVDDGSKDDTADVAARYPEVRYIHQENQGSAHARNTGICESVGTYLVFLDADDRLLPKAFETALDCLNTHTDVALVFGLCKLITADGSCLSTFQPCRDNHVSYLTMLRGCPIRHPAAAMCRRRVFDSEVRFQTSLEVCSDYDFYLKVSRNWPIYCHNNLVSAYRQHPTNKSVNARRMVKYLTSILRAQGPFIQENRLYEEAREIGLRGFKDFYFRQAIKHVRTYVRRGGDGKQVLENVLMLIESSPSVLARLAMKQLRRFGKTSQC